MTGSTARHTVVSRPVPHFDRPDAGLALISESSVANREEQLAAMNGVMEVWRNARPTLPAAFLSRACLAGTDGVTILHYGQWTSGEDRAAFVGTADAEKVSGGISALAPGLPAEPPAYRHYRSLVTVGERPRTGCVVRVALATDGHRSARLLVDTLVDRFGGEQPHRGGISSHFHISADGTRVRNLSEWVDEESHEHMLRNELREGDDVPRLIAEMPGVRPIGFRRFLPYQGLSRTPPATN